ncbi:MAG: MFS transporter [Xanthomonadaceae bacterium]|nr:MFS transporter [Xanthomonadaceae bacterium]
MNATEPNQAAQPAKRRPPHRWLLLGSLILAGESIYMLPYMRKSFQTSMEATFALSSFEIGTLNALFGLLALVCYLPGGWLADRVSARRLLTISLAGTGLGGLYMATVPGYAGLLAVHAFWGIFTILTFWAALIKATRLWSQADAQGRAFGILDGGRGIVGAGLGSLAALCFALSSSVENGLVSVILVYSLASLAASLAVWLVVPDDPPVASGNNANHHGLHVLDSIGQVVRIAEVWLIATVIFCAYFLFLGSYEFPAYAERGFERSKEFGAWLGAFRDWLRPASAMIAGLVADRISASRAMTFLFMVLAVSYASLALLPADAAWMAQLWAQVTVTALAVFALRGIYFALLEEARIPLPLTGIAVGLISMMAYTPDIIAPVTSGWLVERHPGIEGYRRYFGTLAILASVGLLAISAIRVRAMRTQRKPPHSPNVRS